MADNQEEKTSDENQKEKDNSQNQEEEDVDKIKKERDSAIAQKKNYREKLDKLQDAMKDEDDTPDEPSDNASQDEKDNWREKVDFMLEKQQAGEEVRKEDIELLEKLRNPGESFNEAYENHSDIMELKRKKRQAQNAPKEPSTPTSGKGVSEDFDKKLQEAGGDPAKEAEILQEELEKAQKGKSKSGI